MMSSRRPIACVTLLAVLAGSASAQGLDETFNEGVDLLKRGHASEALDKFQECLAMDPGHDAAYELFQATEHEIWLDLLVEGGEYELVAKRLMTLASVGRKERRDDPDAVRDLIERVDGGDIAERMRAVHTLAANHGEYAVPSLLYALGDPDDDDRRVVHMQALAEMGGDVVLPLVAALSSSDAFLRRNVALTLGYLGDPRAAGFLSAVAGKDVDEGVRNAAAEAASRCGGGSNAVHQLLAIGNAWHASNPVVLMPHQISNVVWGWNGNTLSAVEVPTYLYNEELAKIAFYAALRFDPNSNEALAGMARASSAQHAELAWRAGVGGDVGDWPERLAGDDLAIQVAGANALDLALLWALEMGDDLAATGLCRALGLSATTPTQGLNAAQTSRTSGAVRGEAAVALATIAHSTSSSADAATVAALGEAVARDVLHIAAIIDGDGARRVSLHEGLHAQGLAISAWPTGARGLASLRKVPGIDVLLVAETLPDLTFDQVVDEVRRDPALAETPILILAEDGEAAMDLWGDRVAGAITGPADLGKVAEALAGGMNRDREEANRLAASAARALQGLASAGHTELGDTPFLLAGALTGKPDDVTVPTLGVLVAAGGVGQVNVIAGVLSDDGRSDSVRQAAGDALGGIFARNPVGADDATLEAINSVATSEASFGVRRAAATALGRLDLSAAMRADLVEGVRARLDE